MHRLGSQLLVSAVALVLGLLVVVQLRSQAPDPRLAAMSAQELSVVIANLNTSNDELRREIAGLERSALELTEGRNRGESSLDAVRDDLVRVRAWAGLEPVTGPGVSVTLSGQLNGVTVEYLVNELRNGGAEAIAIERERLVPGLVVTGASGELRLGSSVVPDPFEIQAIGSPSALVGSLTRGGGPVAQLAATHPDVVVTVTPVERLALPATQRSLIPQNGRPSL
jgi:uncharacterized protein YlxW (UPF0749 family)